MLNIKCRITSMGTILCMYLLNYFCTLHVFDGQVFLEINLGEFLFHIANRKNRTMGMAVHINQYKNCGYVSNIY